MVFQKGHKEKPHGWNSCYFEKSVENEVVNGHVQTRSKNPTSPFRSILLRAGRPDFRWAFDLPRRLSIRRSILPARRPTAAARVAIRPTPQKNSSTSYSELSKSAKESVDKSNNKVAKSFRGVKARGGTAYTAMGLQKHNDFTSRDPHQSTCC